MALKVFVFDDTARTMLFKWEGTVCRKNSSFIDKAEKIFRIQKICKIIPILKEKADIKDPKQITAYYDTLVSCEISCMINL